MGQVGSRQVLVAVPLGHRPREVLLHGLDDRNVGTGRPRRVDDEPGVLGRSVEPIVGRFLSNMPVSFPIAHGPVRLCGAIIDIDESTGKAVAIERFSELQANN